MNFSEPDHPRVPSGRFTDKPQTPAAVTLTAAPTAQDTLSAEIIDRCPDALSWTVHSTGTSYAPAIDVHFAGGTILFEPHILDETHLHDTLDELWFEQGSDTGDLTVDLDEFRAASGNRPAVEPEPAPDWEQALVAAVRARYPKAIGVEFEATSGPDGVGVHPVGVGWKFGGVQLRVDLSDLPELVAPAAERVQGAWDVAQFNLRESPGRALTSV